MEDSARRQIKLILEQLTDQMSNSCDTEIEALIQRNAANGSLLSGGTIKAAVRKLEELSSDFIQQAADGVKAVSKEPEAFAMIREAAGRFVAHADDEAEIITRLVAGPADSCPSAHTASKELWDKSITRLERQIELHRFRFTEPATTIEQRASASNGTQKNPGGKPLAPHWDALWATVAVGLYTGDLQPKSQADIERHIKDWFAAHNLDVGDTAVRSRARQLWQRLELEL